MRVLGCKLFEKHIIGDGPTPLLVRYILFRLPRFGVYLHKLCRSDFERALHDHPWPFISVILRGGYVEVHNQTIDGSQVFEPHTRGDILIRPAEWRHRFILDESKPPTWTLVLVGRRQRKWGFFLKGGWCWWRKHNANLGICEEEIIHAGGSD